MRSPLGMRDHVAHALSRLMPASSGRAAIQIRGPVRVVYLASPWIIRHKPYRRDSCRYFVWRGGEIAGALDIAHAANHERFAIFHGADSARLTLAALDILYRGHQRPWQHDLRLQPEVIQLPALRAGFARDGTRPSLVVPLARDLRPLSYRAYLRHAALVLRHRLIKEGARS